MTTFFDKNSPGQRVGINQRQKALITILIGTLFVFCLAVSGFLMEEERIATDLLEKNLPPSLQHFFGTDWLGRDMFSRTIMGLSLSIGVGIIGALSSTVLAVIFGVCAATMGKRVDQFISWLIEVFLSVPHLVTLILISFTLGGGLKGIIIGIAITHWASLARVIRAEVMHVRASEYVQISKKMGKTHWWIIFNHILPYTAPQILIGFLLKFPHAILHESAITFLGFGISPHEPAIGIILSESMKYLSSGAWWPAFFPGLCLVVIARIFDVMGTNFRILFENNRTLH